MLASKVRAGEAGVVADEICEQESRLDLALHDLAVDLDRNFSAHGTYLVRCAAWVSARSVMTCNKPSRYSRLPWMSEVGCRPSTAPAPAARLVCSSSAARRR